jgi:elongation factor P--beta-lysine ligase
MALQDVQVVFPLRVRPYVPPFKNLVVQSYPQLQASLADYLQV